jgi:hypothetical protein
LAVEERGELVGAEGGDGGDGFFHLAAELGAEGFVVGLGGELGEGGFVAAEADFLDVEFVGDDVGEGPDEVEEGVVAADDMEGGEGLADLEVEVGAELAGEADDLLDLGHLGFEGFVAGEGAGEGVVAEVDGLGHVRRAQVAVDLLGEERGEGGGDLAQAQEHGVEGLVGAGLVGVVLALPEAAARAADVPVGEVVDELHERAHGLLEVVGVQGGDDVAGEMVEGGEDPAVHEAAAGGGGGNVGMLEWWMVGGGGLLAAGWDPF